jgi:hypothetical protein
MPELPVTNKKGHGKDPVLQTKVDLIKQSLSKANPLAPVVPNGARQHW